MYAHSLEEVSADHKRSHTLGPAEESAASTDPAETAVLTMPHVGSTSCFCSPTSPTLLSKFFSIPLSLQLCLYHANVPYQANIATNYYYLKLTAPFPEKNLTLTCCRPDFYRSEGSDLWRWRCKAGKREGESYQEELPNWYSYDKS